jgi:hypothetical protein
MHIKAFEYFSLSKLGGKQKKDAPGEKDEKAAKIAEMEKKINKQTKDRKKTTDKSNGPAAKVDITGIIDVPPVRPHGPAGELEVDPDDAQNNAGITLDEVESNDNIKLGEEIKIAEVKVQKDAPSKAAPVTTPAVPAEEKKEATLNDSDSLNSLFSTDEEEENPLASLINSLPDVTAQELMDDLAEIHRIIKEWKLSRK